MFQLPTPRKKSFIEFSSLQTSMHLADQIDYFKITIKSVVRYNFRSTIELDLWTSTIFRDLLDRLHSSLFSPLSVFVY